MMNPQTMLAELKGYVVKEILNGAGGNLDETTPLLEWGILDSVSMAGLLGFIEQRFGVEVPDEEMVPDHFENLEKMVSLITMLRDGVSPSPASS